MAEIVSPSLQIRKFSTTIDYNVVFFAEDSSRQRGSICEPGLRDLGGHRAIIGP